MFDYIPPLQRKLEIEIEAAQQQMADGFRAAKLTAQKQERALDGLIREPSELADQGKN